MSSSYPRTFSHIGISVPDLEAAVRFYTEVLGWYLIMEPTDVVEDEDPNVEELAEKIVAAGGKRRMKAPRYYYPGEKPYRMIYMEDPFGNILEIYSHSYELHYSSGAYQ